MTVPSGTGAARTDYRTLTEVADYAEAQRLVDYLSDGGFPVENVRIVGTGIRSVEQVTGRQTTARAAGMGAAAGAWWGLLIGLLFSFFVVGTGWIVMVLTAVVMGAVGGALVGFVGHWATRGKRDFTSVRGMEAAHYEVEVAAAFHDQAMRAAGLR